MTTYRVGGSWKTHTIILEGSEPADENGKRPDDLPVAWIDSAAPEGLAERICRLLNADEAMRPEVPATGNPECGWCTAEGHACPVHVQCDCDHEGLDPMFHLSPCPIAVERHRERGRP